MPVRLEQAGQTHAPAAPCCAKAIAQSIQSENFSRIPGFFPGLRENVRIGENLRNLRNCQSRGFGPHRRSRSQHSNPGGARCLSSASVAQMLAAASIKVMDALFGFLARNDAEWTKRELLGRTWRRDWAMRQFRPKNAFLGDRKNLWGLDARGDCLYPQEKTPGASETITSSRLKQNRFWVYAPCVPRVCVCVC